MAGKFTQMADEVLGGIGLIREGAPEAMKAFAGLSVSATATKALAAVYGADALRAYDEFSTPA